MLSSLVMAVANDTTFVVHPGPMWFPPIVFGILMLVVLLALVAVTFAFRNMAASHPENPRVYLYEPIGHPGQPIEGGDHTEAH